MPIVVVQPQTLAPAEQLVRAGSPPSLIVNRDDANQLYISTSKIIKDGNYDIIDPNACLQVSGKVNVYGVSSAAAPIVVSIIPEALTYATTPQAINNLGSQVVAGIAPYVPQINSVSAIGKIPSQSPVTVWTATYNQKIWAVSLAGSIATISTFTNGLTRAYAALETSDGRTLEVIEMGVGTTDQTDSQHGDLSFNGLALDTGQSIILDINGGNSYVGFQMLVSCNVLYS